MAAKSKKTELFPRLVQLNQDGMTIQEACAELGIHPMTASAWFKAEGVAPVRVRTGRRIDRTTRATFACQQCGKGFEDYARKPRKFCSLECTNQWQVENRSAFRECPCGRQITLAEGASTMYSYRKYCSPECRAKYGKKRQPDPAKQITFNCGTCGKEVTRRRGYGSTTSGLRFCSNHCAARHTKTVRHYVARESDMVLDSTWEMLFAGLCGWHKIPATRVERSTAVAVADGSAYAPDFIVDETIAIEVKGHDTGAQHAGWQAWREQMGPLVVVDRGLLDLLRQRDTREAFLQALLSAPR